MQIVFADFNAMTEDGKVRLNCRGSQEDLQAHGLGVGDRVWLSDGELQVAGLVEASPDGGLVAAIDWQTLVDLDE